MTVIDLTAMVKLLSSDQQMFEVELEVAKKSITLQNTIEGKSINICDCYKF